MVDYLPQSRRVAWQQNRFRIAKSGRPFPQSPDHPPRWRPEEAALDRYSAWNEDLSWFQNHSPCLTEALAASFCRQMQARFRPSERGKFPLLLQGLRRKVLDEVFSTESVEKAVV
jgi:hypothetical protein